MPAPVPASASAPAPAAPSIYTPLPHRQEAFARHVAAGRGYAGAARLSGYAWAGARQTGSRLMKQPEVAARVVELTEADKARRHAELDELVAAAKRVLIDAMEKQNHFAALRAIDQIARLRGLAGPTAEARDTALDADPEPDDNASACSSIAEPEAQFEPQMPPAGLAPVEPAPEDPEKADARQAKANYRHTKRSIEILRKRHPDLYARVSRGSMEDAGLYFDAGLNLLPPDRWPGAASPAHP
ncbi:hypothetical protein [Skermanella pratensis]|uniref:hypothetical protein n=1 Tax=Skermanella pratensis TaxID=2233999 RepID=UPI0017886578|nr:hypothetical protein [Skermanella pratensis]